MAQGAKPRWTFERGCSCVIYRRTSRSRLPYRLVEGSVMRRSLWFGLTTATILVWLAPGPRCFAQNAAVPDQAGLSKLEQELTALALDLLRAEALSDELKDESRVLSTEPQGSDAKTTRFFRAPENVWKNAFPDQLPRDGQADGVLEHLALVQREIDKHQKESTRAWTHAKARTLELRKNLRKDGRLDRLANGFERAWMGHSRGIARSGRPGRGGWTGAFRSRESRSHQVAAALLSAAVPA